MSTKMDAAGRLLAAEVDYLNACGWVPSVVQGVKPPNNILWHKPPATVRVNQAVALSGQKSADNWPEVKDG